MRRILLLVVLTLIPFLFVSPVSADGGTDSRVILGGSVVVDEGEVVDDLILLGGSAKVLGKVTGDAVIFGGSAVIEGEVRGDLVVFGGSVDLKSTAFVGKDVAVFGGSLRKDPGATIGGSTVRGEGLGFALPGTPNFSFRLDSNPFWGFLYGLVKGLFATIALLGIGILLVAFFPRQLEVTEDVVENAFWQSTGVGLLTVLAVVFLTPILVISLIGIPFAFLLWLALFLGILYALVATANLVGERVTRASLSRAVRPLENTLVGLLLIMAVVIPLNAVSGGCLGTLLMLVLVMPGIGAAVLSRFGTMRWHPGTIGGPPPGRMFPPPAQQPPQQPPEGTGV